MNFDGARFLSIMNPNSSISNLIIFLVIICFVCSTSCKCDSLCPLMYFFEINFLRVDFFFQTLYSIHSTIIIIINS